ncbi:MAG: GNAT family N-acetyltransferase [Flavobacteriales bacterium]|nr:GNAT family N-acetyltransferase [Flavobacteriales bacterium]
MIRIIQPSTVHEMEQYYDLRWKTLREPWGQVRGTEKDNMEDSSIHFMALEGEIPLGVCRLQFNDESIAQVRFMGVSALAREKGVGRKLLEEAEKTAAAQGRKKMILQARDYAVPFYEKCNYRIVEKTFLLWDSIQHYLMEKELN